MWGLIVGSLLALGGGVVLVTRLEAWGDLGSGFGDRSVATAAAGLCAVPALVLAGPSWAGVRRTVP